MPAQRDRIDYPELLRALGHFIQREHLSEVNITEFDRGWVITGLTYQTTLQGFVRVPVDYVLSHNDVRAIIQSLVEQRHTVATPRRGWLR